jgi:hypothetical protein
MDTTDNVLAIGSLTVLMCMACCVVGYVMRKSCIHKEETLLNNGDDGISEV